MKKVILSICATLLWTLTAMAQAPQASASIDDVPCDGSVQITATPEAGFHFVKWVDAESNEYTDATLVVPNIKAAKTFTAHFAANSLDFGDFVTITPANPQVGDEITVTFTPDDCEVFDQWSDGNTDLSRTFIYDGTAPFQSEHHTKVFQVNVTTSTGDVSQGSVMVSVVP